MPWSVRTSIDVHGACATDAFPAVVIECNRVLSFMNEPLIQHVEHFQERHFRRNVLHLIGLESSFVLAVLLPPHFQCEVHCVVFHLINIIPVVQIVQVTFLFYQCFSCHRLCIPVDPCLGG